MLPANDDEQKLSDSIFIMCYCHRMYVGMSFVVFMYVFTRYVVLECFVMRQSNSLQGKRNFKLRSSNPVGRTIFFVTFYQYGRHLNLSFLDAATTTSY